MPTRLQGLSPRRPPAAAAAWLQHVWRARVCPGCPGCLPPPGHMLTHHPAPASQYIVHQDFSSGICERMWCVKYLSQQLQSGFRMSGHWINARDKDDLKPRVCTIVLFLRLSVSGLAHRAGHSFVGIARNCYHTPYAIVIAHKIINNHNHV